MKSFVDDFERYLLHERNASKHTVSNYMRDIKGFMSFLDILHEGEAPDLPADVTPDDITGFVASLYGRQKKSTVARKLSSVRSLFTFLV
ncbi:MAG: site-specific integrase, partial [Thermodesulfobacteriota bacterium]